MSVIATLSLLPVQSIILALCPLPSSFNHHPCHGVTYDMSKVTEVNRNGGFELTKYRKVPRAIPL